MVELTRRYYWLLPFTRRRTVLHEASDCVGLLHSDGSHKPAERLTRKRAQEEYDAGRPLCQRCRRMK